MMVTMMIMMTSGWRMLTWIWPSQWSRNRATPWLANIHTKRPEVPAKRTLVRFFTFLQFALKVKEERSIKEKKNKLFF